LASAFEDTDSAAGVEDWGAADVTGLALEDAGSLFDEMVPHVLDYTVLGLLRKTITEQSYLDDSMCGFFDLWNRGFLFIIA